MEPQPSTSNSSSTKKNPSRKLMHSCQKIIIINLYKDLIKREPAMKYRPMIKRLAEESGLGQLAISKTIAEYKETGGSVTSPNTKRPRLAIREKTTEEDINAIQKKVHDFWFRREIPTMKKILQAVNDDPQLANFSESTLYRLLESTNLKCVVRARNSVLIDKNYIVSWRQKYLESIFKFRKEGRHIYYLDETWINAGDCRLKLWVDKAVTSSEGAERSVLSTGIPEPTGKGKRLIVAHIGSSDGFVPGGLLCYEAKKNSADYHQDEMNGDTFFTWFRNLLPMLRDGSVIVMDSAPHHSMKLEKYPTMGWTKNDIITWLVMKGEKAPPDYVKARLIELVDKHKRLNNNYVVDEYARLHNFTVLRLPPYHCQLNPIELAWAMVKNYIKVRNTTYELADVKKLLIDGIENVSAASWQNFIAHTTEEEKNFQRLDHITDDLLDDSGDEWLELSDESDAQVCQSDSESEGEL